MLLPVLVSLLPALLVLAGNIQQAHSASVLKLCAVSAAAAIGLTLLAKRATGNRSAAATGTALLVAAWGFYGWIAWASIPVAALGVLILVKRLTPPRWGMTVITGLVSVPLVVAVGVIATVGIPRDYTHTASAADAAAGPDVYFIVLDSYTGAETLQERFGVDSSPFLQQLASLGFSTGTCRSHADHTLESLTYLLNGTHVTDEGESIRHSAVRAALTDRGYTTIAYSTGWAWTEIRDADRYIIPAHGFVPTEVESAVLLQTPLSLFVTDDLTAINGARARARTLSLLAHLPDASHTDGAQFTFAHILQPHPPFVFAADGSPLNPGVYVNPEFESYRSANPEYTEAVYRAGYAAHVTYISGAVLPALTEIVTTAPESIIILTGDHGAWYAEGDAAYSVLCATYGLRSLEARQAVLEVLFRDDTP